MRSGQRELSQTSTSVQGVNALLKNEQQQSAISALGSLYGENMNDTLRALGLSNDSLERSDQALGVANAADANKLNFDMGLLKTILGSAEQGATMGLTASGAPGFGGK